MKFFWARAFRRDSGQALRCDSGQALRRGSGQGGFTLVEAVVVVGITAMMTVISLVYSRSSEKRIALYTDQAKVVGVIERAKSLALQKYRVGGTNVCGMGVVFNNAAQPNTISIFQDIDNDPDEAICRGNNTQESGEIIELVELDRRIAIREAPANPIVFIAPYLETTSAGNIILELRDEPGVFTTIVVNPGGDVSVR